MESVVVVIVGNKQAGMHSERKLIEAGVARIKEDWKALSYTLLIGKHRFDRRVLQAGVTGLAQRLLEGDEGWEVKTVQGRDDIFWYLDPVIMGQSNVILLIGGDPALCQMVKLLEEQGHAVYEAVFQDSKPVVYNYTLPYL